MESFENGRLNSVLFEENIALFENLFFYYNDDINIFT